MKKFLFCLAVLPFISLGIGGSVAQGQAKNCDAMIKEVKAQLASVTDREKKSMIEAQIKEAETAKAAGKTAACQASATKAMQALRPAKK